MEPLGFQFSQFLTRKNHSYFLIEFFYISRFCSSLSNETKMEFVWDHNVKLNSPYALYPHASQSLQAIVPNIQRSQSPVLRIINSPFITIWFLTFLPFTVFRIILKMLSKTRRNEQSVGQITFHTLALLFGAGNNRSIQKVSERMLVWFISMIGLLEGNMLIGQLFSDYSAMSYSPAINTISDLQKTTLSVQVPDIRRDLRELFRYLPTYTRTDKYQHNSQMVKRA